MDLIESIKNNFNKGYFHKAMLIDNLPNEYPAWTIKQDDWIGVAVPLASEIVFSEHFSSVGIWTESNVDIDNQSYNLLLLTCNDMSLRNEFATICSQFVQPGPAGTSRIELTENPDVWWSNWRFLLGNVSSDAEAYAIIGELVAVELLLKKGENPKWSGIENATHDVETATCSYEVKSTISRYGHEATINSVYQMKKSGEKLELIFCRFEPSLLGRSLDDVVQSVVKLGYPAEAIEKALKSKKLEKGSIARSKKYKLIEMKSYIVDEKFPLITEASFKNDVLPQNILKLKYTVDLSGLSCTNLL